MTPTIEVGAGGVQWETMGHVGQAVCQAAGAVRAGWAPCGMQGQADDRAEGLGWGKLTTELQG